jgi:hypothetical protein
MKIKYKGSSEATWSPTGDGNKAQTSTQLIIGTGSGQGILIPLTFTAQTEVNTRGVRRAVFKAEGTIPGTLMNLQYPTWDVKKTAPISAHVVVQGPGLALAHEIANGSSQGVLDVLRYLVRNVVSMVTGVSLPDTSSDEIGMDNPYGPFANALIGASPMDVVSGSYGAVSELSS